MGQNPKCPGYNIEEKTKGTSSNISSACIPSLSVNQSFSLLKILWQSLISQCTHLYDVPLTHDVDLLTQYWFNVGPASQPIAGSMAVNHLRRWPNTNPTLGLLYFAPAHQQTHGIRPTLLQYWPTFFDAGPTLKQNWVIVPCLLWLICGWYHPFPDNTIHWPDADIVLGHRLRRWTNIIPTKTL